MILNVQIIELVLIYNVLILVLNMIHVAKMQFVKHWLTEQYVNVQVDGLVILMHNVSNVGFLDD